MSNFIGNLNFYLIKCLLKINKLINRNGLCEKEGYCKFEDIKKYIHCKKISIQLYEKYNKEELFKILPLLVNSNIEIELIDFNKSLESKDIRKLEQISPKITVNFRYMIDSYYSGSNVELTYNMECYSKILDKIEYLTKTAKMNFSKQEEQIMFVASQLSEYISFYNKYSELDSEQFKQKSSLKGAFLEKETVCIGYAMAFERCMSDLGVNCKIATGEGNFGEKSKIFPWEGNHAWNVVEINEKWYNIDVTWLSSYKNNVDLKATTIDEKTEDSIIGKYVLSSDNQFTDHYKLEDNGVSCKASLEGRFEIFERVKIYKNVLEEYDNGKRNHMLQVKLGSNPINYTDRSPKENIKQLEEMYETSK